MEQQQAKEETVLHLNDTTTAHTSTEAPPPVAVTPQALGGSCPACAAAQASPSMTPPTCVYVIGHIEPRYPLLSVEKEAMQAVKHAGAAKETDRQVMAKVLRDPNNKYLVRQLCWVLSVQGIETYILVPRDPADYQLLVDAYRAEPNPGDLELVIGRLGPIAPPTMCNGLLVPIVIFEQIYAFDRKSLLDAIPVPKDVDEKKFRTAAGEVFDRIIQQSDNHGATPEDIAKNYLAVRYPGMYQVAAEQFAGNSSFTSIDVLPSPLSGTRKVVDVVFSFSKRDTGVVSKFFTRVDVTECFPFLVSPMAPYYDR